jgi:hypothetical protein
LFHPIKLRTLLWVVDYFVYICSVVKVAACY